MEEKFAKVISYLLHPLLLPTYALLVLFGQSAYFMMMLPTNFRWAMLGLIFGNTVLLPVIIIWMMRAKGLISSMQLTERRERTFPFIIAALAYFTTYFMLRNLGLPAIYLMFVLGGAILTVLATLINLFWKISIHMLGMGGITGGFIGLMLFRSVYSPMLLIVIILLSGLVAFSRLKLNTHNESQVYTGYLVGVVVMLGMVTLL